MRKLPPQSLLREILDYNRLTGVFTWKVEPRTVGPLFGKKAGTRKRGYSFIGFREYGQIGTHRLAWIWCYGDIPAGVEVDHKDGDASNNAIGNLRLATSTQQKQNKGIQSNNRSGLKGAYYHACRKGKKWRSQIKVGPDLIFIGYFHTAEEAHHAYLAAAEEYFGEYACREPSRVRRVAA
jgi:hypothetical protein